jgi:hypothetical protein
LRVGLLRARGRCGIGGFGLGDVFRFPCLQLLKPQFELGDLMVDPLRRAAELHPPQFGNLEFELFDLQGLVLHRQLGRPQLVLAGQGEGTERGGIGGQFSRGERHDQIYQACFLQNDSKNRIGALLYQHWSARRLRCYGAAPIHCLNQHSQLRR